MKWIKEVIDIGRSDGQVIASHIEDMSESEIENSIRLHKAGRCGHMPIRDEEGFMYDIRTCALCGAHLGFI